MSEAPYRRPNSREMVSNAPLRARYERSDMTLTDVALEAGWTRSRKDRRPNPTRVARALGLSVNHGHLADSVTYLAAVELARALDLDPTDAGV